MRQVPDNQEVFLEADGPTSLIVELLECPQDTVAKEEGCLYYLRDLVEGDGGFELQSQAKVNVEKEIICATVDKDTNVKMCMYRPRQVNADILITMNRQPPTDPLSFEDIAKSLTVKDWSLFK